MSGFSLLRLFNRWRDHCLRIGIEIGEASIRAVVLERHRRQWYVRACGVQLLDGDTDDVLAQQSALTRLLMRLGVRKGVTSVTMSTPIMSRTITLPSGLQDDEIDLLIRLDADKYIPYPLDEVCFDFWVLGDDGREMSVLLIIGRASMVDRCVEIAAGAALDVEIVDVHEYALIYGLLPTIRDLVGQVLVIHIDDMKTYVYAMRLDDHQDFSGFNYRQEYLNQRTKSTSDVVSEPKNKMDAYTEELTDKDGMVDGMDFHEFLVHYNQTATQEIVDSTAANPKNTVLKNMDVQDEQNMENYEIRFDDVLNAKKMDEKLKLLNHSSVCIDRNEQVTNLQKIILSYEYSAQIQVDSVVVSGLSDEGVVIELSNVLDVPVHLADPFRGMNVSRSIHHVQRAKMSQLVVACGLAIRAFDRVDDE